MKTIMTFITGLIISVGLRAQSPVIQNIDTTANKLDSIGRKQGLWIYAHKLNGGSYCIESEGYYKDNKKVGKWQYYSTESDNIGYSHSINYKSDGSVEYISTRKTISINRDSSSIKYILDKTERVVCTKNKSGGYDCTRFYSNKAVQAKKTFENFEDTFNHLQGKW